jgi:hypothetical protein
LLGASTLEVHITFCFVNSSMERPAQMHRQLTVCIAVPLCFLFSFLLAAGALVVPVSLAGSPPFTGLLDLSAASSMLNW